VDKKVYNGPLSKQEAEEALKAMKDAADYKVAKVQGTGGSLTALPIIETLLGDISAYIPTNVISITDGQIFLESNLFNAGIRPGVNVGVSVSRVGGDAQTKAMKQVAARLRLDMAAFRELAAFAQFGSDLDKATQAQLGRGQRMQEILKQPQYSPMSLENQVTVLFAGTNGFADQVPIEKMRQWEIDLVRYMESAYPEIGKSITAENKITDDNRAMLTKALEAFKISWQG
jgi:F-type H+-transporting ATPase subunit alpha